MKNDTAIVENKNDIAALDEREDGDQTHDTTPFFPVNRSVRRNGKVSRLPLDARTTVNTMLDDGKTYLDIIAKLTELGHPGFVVQNISRWKLGGYKEWLEEKRGR